MASFLKEYMHARALASSPSYAAKYKGQAEQRQREQFITGLMGQAPQKEVLGAPQDMQGPLRPGKERGQIQSVLQPEVQGSGVLGGQMTPQETALRMMMAPTESTRKVGGAATQARLMPAKPDAYTDLQRKLQMYRDNPDEYAAFMQAGRSPLVEVNTGSGADVARPMTDEDKRAYGMPLEKPAYFDNKGNPKAAPDQSVMVATAKSRVKQGLTGIETAEKYLYNKDGTVNRGMLGMRMVGGKYVPKSDARGFDQAMGRSVEILLRMATGAAAPDQEVANYKDMYSPSYLDSDEQIKAKLNSYKGMMKDLSAQLGGADRDPTLAEIRSAVSRNNPMAAGNIDRAGGGGGGGAVTGPNGERILDFGDM